MSILKQVWMIELAPDFYRYCKKKYNLEWNYCCDLFRDEVPHEGFCTFDFDALPQVIYDSSNGGEDDEKLKQAIRDYKIEFPENSRNCKRQGQMVIAKFMVDEGIDSLLILG